MKKYRRYLLEVSDGTTILDECGDSWKEHMDLIERAGTQLGSPAQLTSSDTGRLADGRTFGIREQQ